MTKKSNKKASNFNFVDFIDENRNADYCFGDHFDVFGLFFGKATLTKSTSGIDKNKIIANTDQSGGIEEHVYAGTSKNSKVALIEYGDFQRVRLAPQ